jgi:hypothetical protein
MFSNGIGLPAAATLSRFSGCNYSFLLESLPSRNRVAAANH